MNHGFWTSLVRDVTGRGMFGGPFQLRLIFQPLAAIVLGVRFGLRDAKSGDVPFFMALLHHKGKRGHLLKKAIRDAIVPLAVAFLIDSILQAMINHRIRPLVAVIVGTFLVFLPFLAARGLTNRIATLTRAHHRRVTS